MTNIHKYELSFFGNPRVRYTKRHDTIESATNEARRVLSTVAKRGGNRGEFTGLVSERTGEKNGHVFWKTVSTVA